MLYRKLSMSFLASLCEDKSAMRAFAAMNDADRSALENRLSQAKTREDIRVIAMSLSDSTDAVEYH